MHILPSEMFGVQFNNVLGLSLPLVAGEEFFPYLLLKGMDVYLSVSGDGKGQLTASHL